MSDTRCPLRPLCCWCRRAAWLGAVGSVPPRASSMTAEHTGQFAFTPLKDFTASLNWIAGPEQIDNTSASSSPIRFQGLDTRPEHRPRPASRRTPEHRCNVVGWAAYAASDWTENLRTALARSSSVTPPVPRPGWGLGRIFGPRRPPSSTRSGRPGGPRRVPARRLRREGLSAALLAPRHHVPGLLARGKSMGHDLGEPSARSSSAGATQAVAALTAA